MLNFQNVDDLNLKPYQDYFAQNNLGLAAYSYSYQIFWAKLLHIQFAWEDNFLFLCQNVDGITYFYFPLLNPQIKQANDQLALEKIAQYCLAHHLPLQWMNIPSDKLAVLGDYFGGNISISSDRRWNDYIYLAQEFKNYSGKKYNTCRNNVNKFLKLYPQAQFHSFQINDRAKYLSLLEQWETKKNLSQDVLLQYEELGEKKLIKCFDPHYYCGGYVTINNEIVGLSIGEYCGQTLVIHLEKANAQYKGVYQYLAQQFALAFANEKIIYLNREDDAGIIGLRKSKLQYQPHQIKQVWNVLINHFELSKKDFPIIQNQLYPLFVLDDLKPKDEYKYFELSQNYAESLAWGWDYKNDLAFGQEISPNFFAHEREISWKKEQEYSWIIYYQNQLAGEVTLYHVDYHQHGELGIRVLPHFRQHHIGKIACSMLIDQCLKKWGFKTIWAKCQLDNLSSFKLLTSLKMAYLGKDDQYHYFYLGEYIPLIK